MNQQFSPILANEAIDSTECGVIHATRQFNEVSSTTSFLNQPPGSNKYPLENNAIWVYLGRLCREYSKSFIDAAIRHGLLVKAYKESRFYCTPSRRGGIERLHEIADIHCGHTTALTEQEFRTFLVDAADGGWDWLTVCTCERCIVARRNDQESLHGYYGQDREELEAAAKAAAIDGAAA